jgi:signal transduction histidine kinase
VWVALLVNLLLSRSAGTFVPNIFILVTVIVLGIFVIRSVIKEVEQREKLAIANAGQESLIHIMNHQIKGYLGKDRSIFAELITGDYGSIPDSAKPLLQEGLEQSARGVDYVQGILRGASAANGVLPYDMKDMDIKSIVTDIINHQKPIAEAKGLSFSSEIDDGDYILYGDPTQLGEALRNLVENAIRYNSINGSVFVTLHKDTKNVLFSVKDSGVGVADDVKSRLFTPGGRSKDSTKYNPESSGFGLAFVKGVIETHHGTVGYRPNVGEKGTTFFVQLPFSKEA